jgi:octaprenyl-diphosphate synthase
MYHPFLYNGNMEASHYTPYLEKIEERLRVFLTPECFTALPPISTGAPLSYEALFTPIYDLLERGGKRWRPLLLCLVADSLDASPSQSSPSQAASSDALALVPLVEFSHNASLVHDDIEDNSPERRGKPALHNIYGIDAALNAGSFLYFLSTRCIDLWDACAEKKLQLYTYWSDFMRRLHLGQSLDIDWHRRAGFFPTPAEYYAMCALKTGCLARFAAGVGVLAAGAMGSDYASPTLRTALELATEKLGVAFQIIDDVKNLDCGIVGKTRGDDLVEGKKSLPLILYVQSTNISESEKQKRREQIMHAFDAAKTDGVSAAPAQELLASLEASGVFVEAQSVAAKFMGEAKSAFTALKLTTRGCVTAARAAELLEGLPDYLL